MRIKKISIFASLALFAVIAASPSVRAEEHVCQVCSKAGKDSASYGAKAGTTLTRGAANTLFGWTELFRQPAEEAKSGGNVLTGIGKGIGQSVKRTLGGVGEILTFWTPKVNNHYLAFSSDCPVCMKRKEEAAKIETGQEGKTN